MAGDPNQETTEGTRRRRSYERLDGKKHRPPGQGCPVQPEILLESIRDAFFVLDRDWRYTYVNERGAALFEAAPEKLIGRTVWETLPSAYDLRFRQECLRAIEQGTVAEFEEYYDPPGRWFICRCRPAGDALAVSLADITEFRQAEKALRDSEQRLRLVLDGGRMGRWEWDLQTDAMSWCHRVHDLFGLDPRIPATRDVFLARIHPEDREELQTLVKKALAERTDFQAEFRVERDRGETRREILWVTVRGKVICDEQGCAVRMLGVLYDVTDRKQMEAELLGLNQRLDEEVRAQMEEMKATIERLQDEVARRVLAEGRLRKRSQMLDAFFQHTITPLAFLDRSFNFIRVNDAYAKADGKTPEYFAGRNHFMLYPDAEMRELFEQVVRTKRPYRAHARPFRYPDAPMGVRYWNWQLTPLLTDTGDVRLLVFSLEDVTEQRGAVYELERRAHQLRKLSLELSKAEDRERRRLAEVLHDDLQQVLAAAKFHLGMLTTRIHDDETLRELTDQIRDLLKEAIARSRSLSHELSPAVLYQSDLGETFEWLARHVQAKHGLVVHVEVRGRIDPQSEPLRAFLYRAAQEVLFNVVKHAGVGEARLRVQYVRDHVWLTIADKGCGFDPRTLAETGGFGLFSVRERVQLLGGRMRIRSAPGRGSTFLISVPDREVPSMMAAPAPEEPLAPPPEPRENHAYESVGRILRVLLVDDHKVVREGLAALLDTEPDIDVVGQAANGREAVAMAGELEPDVIVMDVAMPVMAGDEATRHIKRDLPQTRVIALSMFEEPSVAERMRQAGAEAYLLKTSPAEELLAAIRGIHRGVD